MLVSARRRNSPASQPEPRRDGPNPCSLRCAGRPGLTGPVGIRKALANAPRWVRASWWSVVFGVYFGVVAWIGFHTWASAVTLIVAGMLLGVALGPVVMWSEPWERRKLARRLVFLGVAPHPPPTPTAGKPVPPLVCWLRLDCRPLWAG